MPETLPEFLKQRTVRACRSFQKEIDGVTIEEAFHDSSPNWQPHKWGIGQNGSIAGIVFHVTAWLTLSLPALQGGSPLAITDFANDAAPSQDDWQAIRKWFEATAAIWTQALTELPNAGFDRPLEWEGQTITVAECLIDLYEHFVYHDGQIQYLKQKHLADAHGNS